MNLWRADNLLILYNRLSFGPEWTFQYKLDRLEATLSYIKHYYVYEYVCHIALIDQECEHLCMYVYAYARTHIPRPLPAIIIILFSITRFLMQCWIAKSGLGTRLFYCFVAQKFLISIAVLSDIE